MRAYVEGLGLAGPGLRGWQASRAVLAGSEPYHPAPTAVVPSALLPPAERRRMGLPVKLALAAGEEAFAGARRELTETATVFASSSGDCDNLHQLLEVLATPEKQVSPTRFHNSVHNVVAGYWSIATQCRAASTSLCGCDATFAAGLLEAASQVVDGGAPVALIAYDHPYPEPLNAVRAIRGEFGTALVLAPEPTDRSVCALDVVFVPRERAATGVEDAGLEALRAGVPAARSLPLLAALARGSGDTIILEYVTGTHLRVTLTPCN